MELLARLIWIALDMAQEYCIIGWHPDDANAPLCYDAELEIRYEPAISPLPHSSGDYHIILDDALYCIVNANTRVCWHAYALRWTHVDDGMPLP